MTVTDIFKTLEGIVKGNPVEKSVRIALKCCLLKMMKIF